MSGLYLFRSRPVPDGDCVIPFTCERYELHDDCRRHARMYALQTERPAYVVQVHPSGVYSVEGFYGFDMNIPDLLSSDGQVVKDYFSQLIARLESIPTD